MATSMTINRFRAKLRASPSQHERLRRILGEAIDGGLEASVERHGIGRDGEVCIRQVHALIRLAPSESDENLSAKLAFAIAEAIQSEVGKDDADIVRYGSQAHALADFAASALSGDFNRAWAWRQMGISDREFAVSVADATGQVITALTANPQHATAILAHLAHDTVLFGRLLENASAEQWLALARRVLAEAGGEALLRAAGTGPVLPRPADTAKAGRVVGQSRIAKAVLAWAQAGGKASPGPQWLAVFALNEAEPALLCGPVEPARALLTAITQILSAPAQSTARPGGVEEPKDHSLQPSEMRGAEDRVLRPARQDGTQNQASSAQSQDARPAPSIASPPGSALDGEPGLAKARPPQPPQFVPSQHDLPDVRQRGHTAFGGLLYLLHSVGPLAERMVTEPRLSQRNPRWCLHQLALALLPISARDPAALAFAGLLPGGEPPGEDQPPPDEREREALMELRQALVQDLRERLARYDIAESVRLDFVCRRPAEIVADPGWLEVHFSLDEVSTEIRATGLDRDPGWVPCLGLVVRFVYV